MNTVEGESSFKLFNFRPVFFGAIILALGILFAYFTVAKGASPLWLLFVFPIALIFFFIYKAEKNFLAGLIAALVFLLLFFVGYYATAAQLRAFSSATPYAGEQMVNGRVERIEEKGSLTRLTLSNLSIGGRAEDGVLYAYLPNYQCEEVRRLDEVFLRGDLQTSTEYFDGDEFRAYEIESNVRYILTSENAVAITGRSGDLFSWINYRLESVLYAGMGQDSASVVMGILLGNVSGLDDTLLQNVRAGGIAHLFAVSGLHVGVLYAFLAWLFGETGLKNAPKWLRFLLTAAILIVYAGICGFTSSVLRAAVLCLCVYAGKLLELKIDRLEIIGLAAILVLLINPVGLFTIGFQLSFLACLGIVLLAKPIGQVCDEFFQWIGSLFVKETEKSETEEMDEDEKPLTAGKEFYNGIVSLLSASLATQIATAPVLLSAFGYLSGWATILNFLFIPLVSGVFAILLLFAVVAAILPLSAAATVLLAPNALFSALLLLFEIVDFSAFALTGIALSGAGNICYYAGCLLLTEKWNLDGKWKSVCSAVMFAGALIATLAVNL